VQDTAAKLEDQPLVRANLNKQCGCSYRCVIDNPGVIDTASMCRLNGAPGATGCGWTYGRLDNIVSSPNATIGKAYSVVKHIYLAKIPKGYVLRRYCYRDTASNSDDIQTVYRFGEKFQTKKNAADAFDQINSMRKVFIHSDTASYLAKGIRFEVQLWGTNLDEVRESTPIPRHCCRSRYRGSTTGVTDTAMVLIPQIARQGMAALVHIIKATSVVLVPVCTWDILMQLSLKILQVKATPQRRHSTKLSPREVRPAPPSDDQCAVGVRDTARRL